jgi:hypothetical protein
MADEPHQGTIGAVTDLGQKIVGTLPPAFLSLVILNTIFLGLVMWFLNGQMEARTVMVSKVLDRCMEIALMHEPPSQKAP